MSISPWDSSKQVFEKVNACSPKAQICDHDLLPCSILSESRSEYHCSQRCPASPHQQLVLPCVKGWGPDQAPFHSCFLDQLSQDIDMNALQKTSGLLVTCCAVPPAGIMVVPWGPGNVNTDLPPVFWRWPYHINMVSWPVADTCHNVVHATLLTNPGP